MTIYVQYLRPPINRYNRYKTVIVYNLASRLEDRVYKSTYNVMIFAINDQNDIPPIPIYTL